MKIAYFCEPQLGGTYTFFRRLRPELSRLGIDFRCIPPVSAEKFAGSRFAGDEGVDFVTLSAELPVATGQIIEFLQQNRYDQVMVLPAADILSSNLPPYLPRTIRCAMRVPMMTRGAYAPTQAVHRHLNRIHAVSDRIADDLVAHYTIPREQIDVIYHGVDPELFHDVYESKSTSGPLNVLYAGRLWDIDKGVFLLPVMMAELEKAGADVMLTVAGGGPDEAELRRRFEQAGVNHRVVMTGPVPLEKMNSLFAEADCFVFPSRFEGCGFAVLEAMSAGCAPVVSDIRGSLRVLVNQGQCGKLARVGDGRDFARGVLELYRDRPHLKQMQQAARERVVSTYTLRHMAENYAASFRSMAASADQRDEQRDLGSYEIPRAFKPTWRTLIPRPVKNFIRTWMERLGRST